ncbi:DEAD/DEAH box helicase [Pedobacter sp. GR22-10]|uniref:DEAD/DEAH box helicase n=1 Tax=Pedobacter sp. GR22-10 TaxID=2994472 RepID=UPI002246C500|nr:DEAD/DEAH box helicase [Pedobacter sp. GR22-10]MCX2429783.1 DEAD/DEAH box helicase [Pedobacter sp. GR22-10]
MTAFDLLSPAVRKFVRDKRWESFRDIQSAAIKKIMGDDRHYILASRTASGKTEAAFLPILSKVDFNQGGVAVLYISPLIALINDQFMRVEDLCSDMEITVTKWHGEANKSLKNKLLKAPQGVVLITPESLEAMFVNKPYDVKNLFSQLKYVVIDEIHSFIGSDRGVHLKSLLSRIQDINSGSFSVIGLSATLGDFAEAKKFTGEAERTVVLKDPAAKDLDTVFKYFEQTGNTLPLELLKDLYRESRDSKVLVFPNSRGRAEDVAVSLMKIAERVGGHANYFSHHSSVDKQVREYVEEFAKSKLRRNFTIACTSTLELGIDIGSVDQVVQLDAAHSIASLIQRVGRSGRREGAKSRLLLYATNPWSLLQSLAGWLLYLEGFIEPPEIIDYPYDILLHQALSITKEHSGNTKKKLVGSLKSNYAFKLIAEVEIVEIVDYLISIDFLEELGRELIIGVEGEKIVNGRDFYTVFNAQTYYKVVSSGTGIGQIPFTAQVRENENILLAAKIWKIRFVDHDAKKIEVVPANDGRRPLFFGEGGDVHPRIREKMMEILYSKEIYPMLDENSAKEIEKLRTEFSVFLIVDPNLQRPMLIEAREISLYSFSGSRINRTLSFFWNLSGIDVSLNDDQSRFKIESEVLDTGEFDKLLIPSSEDLDFHLENFLYANPGALTASKWAVYLPVKYRLRLLKQRYFDFEGAGHFKDMTWVSNRTLDIQ